MPFEFCKRCGRVTETALMPLSSGHVGRVCRVCGACRKGRPYASRREYESTTITADSRPRAARGQNHEAKTQLAAV